MTYQRQEFPHIEKQLSPATTPVALDHGDILDSIKSGLGKLFANIAAWNRRKPTATALNRLDAHMLADIGLTHADIDGAVRRGWILAGHRYAG